MISSNNNIVKIEKITSKSSKNKSNISFDFFEWKTFLYSAIFYCCGLFAGSYFYKISNSKVLDNMLKPEKQGLINMFASNLTIYLVLFLLVIFLGFCLIGFPVINIIPALIGIEYGMELAYLYINNGTKGIAYSIIMIVPFASAFLCVISLAIKYSSDMSKKLLKLTKGEEPSSEFNIKPYLKKILILGLIIILISFLSAVLKSLLFGVVTI